MFGLRFSTNGKNKQPKRAPKLLYVLIFFIAIVVLGVIHFNAKPRPQSNVLEYGLMETVRTITKNYEDENGYVPENALNDVIDEVYATIYTLPEVSYCEKDEYGVSICMQSGFEYVYLPTIKDMDGGSSQKIVTLQPYNSENALLNVQNNWNFKLDALDISAYETSKADSRWQFIPSDDVNDKEVDISRILSLNNYQMILWQGHGGYTRRSGFFLCTTIEITEKLLDQYPCLTSDNIVILTDGTIGLKPSFFASSFKSDAFKNAFIYFATCYSGKEAAFAQTFVEKGAAVVFVNSESINRGYNLDMLHMIVEAFCVGASSPTVQKTLSSLNGYSFNSPENWTISDCLLLAQQCYGEKDPSKTLNAAEVYYIGQKNVSNMTYGQWMTNFSNNSTSLIQPSDIIQTQQPSSSPAISTLADGTYNVWFYKDRYDARPEGTYATVGIETYDTYSDDFVESLTVGDKIDDVVIESLEYFQDDLAQQVSINNWAMRLFKGVSSSEWVLLCPDLPRFYVSEEVDLFFPAEAEYLDQRTGVLEAEGWYNYDGIQLDRIEDFFLKNNYYDEVTVTITVENGIIVEALIPYRP